MSRMVEEEVINAVPARPKSAASEVVAIFVLVSIPRFFSLWAMERGME